MKLLKWHHVINFCKYSVNIRSLSHEQVKFWHTVDWTERAIHFCVAFITFVIMLVLQSALTAACRTPLCCFSIFVCKISVRIPNENPDSDQAAVSGYSKTDWMKVTSVSQWKQKRTDLFGRIQKPCLFSGDTTILVSRHLKIPTYFSLGPDLYLLFCFDCYLTPKTSTNFQLKIQTFHKSEDILSFIWIQIFLFSLFVICKTLVW